MEEAGRYFIAQRGNSPVQLAFFVMALFGLTMARAADERRRLRHALATIPLHIGGWGTRGKSGTERLKASLFQALGYDVMVKTTGCEAMVIHGIPERDALEVFLFRPYDKPTIWEQSKTVQLAADLGVQVFLWECMALRPNFVDVLAHQWMKGRFATLTNAYPDHEDVMGPSGEEVARVIAGFLPEGGEAITAEVEMLPILKAEARRKGTALDAIRPEDADLLPRDLVERIPYQEHPRNVALVAAMAARWGIPRDRAIAAMADCVVPDLGVLKTYPEVTLRSRRVRFSNGMSANERAGALGNWQRLGLADKPWTPAKPS